MQDLALLRKGVEQLLEPVHARQLIPLHQVGLARDQAILRAFGGIHHPLRHLHRLPHDLVHVPAGGLHVRQQTLAHLVQTPAGTQIVQRICRLFEPRRRIVTLRIDDPVMNLAFAGHQNRQYPIPGQRQELDPAEDATLVARHHDHPRQMGYAGKELRGAREQGGGIPEAIQLATHRGHLPLGQLLDGEQGIEEEPVTQIRRYPPGGGMGRGYQPHLFQVRHHIAHRRRAELQPRILR